MKNQYLEAGRIVGTHGIIGQVKVECWCDSPGFLQTIGTFYLGGKPVRVEKSSVHKNLLLAKLQGVDDINAAMRLRGAVVFIDRADAALPEGRCFVQDLIGARVENADTGEEIGKLTQVLSLPAHDVYEVRGAHRYLIPAVPAFIEAVDAQAGLVRVHLIDGMEDDNAH